MAVRHLEVEVRRESGGAVLDLRGEINGFAQEALDAAYGEAEAMDMEAILLNFEEVDYINSTGIALIVGLLARARAEKRRLVAYGLSGYVVYAWRNAKGQHVSVISTSTEEPDERGLHK